MCPIISAINKIGGKLASWLIDKLGLIAAKYRKLQLKDAEDVFNRIKIVKLKSGHVMGSDYDNVFTNISYVGTRVS